MTPENGDDLRQVGPQEGLAAGQHHVAGTDSSEPPRDDSISVIGSSYRAHDPDRTSGSGSCSVV